MDQIDGMSPSIYKLVDNGTNLLRSDHRTSSVNQVGENHILPRHWFSNGIVTVIADDGVILSNHDTDSIIYIVTIESDGEDILYSTLTLTKLCALLRQVRTGMVKVSDGKTRPTPMRLHLSMELLKLQKEEISPINRNHNHKPSPTDSRVSVQ